MVASPFLTVIALWVITNAAVEAVRAIRGKIAPPKVTKKLREEVAELREKVERMEAQSMGGPFRASDPKMRVAPPPPDETPDEIQVDIEEAEARERREGRYGSRKMEQ